MSQQLDAILALAADYVEVTATLSPESLAVIFYCLQFGRDPRNWYDDRDVNDVSDSDWENINEILDNCEGSLL